MEWKAQWIWKAGAVTQNDFGYFRKKFSITGPVRSAKVYVSAHHYFHLFINGMKVGGYGSPAPTLPSHRKLYLTYDIAGLLQEGDNAFGAIVHYLGGSGQNYVNGRPGFLLQAELECSDGDVRSIFSDLSWQALKVIPHDQGTPYQQNRRISAIERYDARRHDPTWARPEYDDRSNLDGVVIADLNGQKWPLKPQEIPEGMQEEIITPVPVGIQEVGRQVFDAGKIVSGWPSLQVEGKEGVTVRMRYSEDLDEQGGVKHHVCNEKSEHYYDEYTMAGRPMETWEPDFSYKAFRYVEVTGCPVKLDGENVKIVSAHTGLTYTGSFVCSNRLLNDIYAACIQTQKNNVLGQLVDCPHREQAQYLADSDLQAETLLYHFNSASVLDKVLEDFTGAQREDGTFPFVFPCNVDAPEFNLEIPEWDLHFVTILWKLFRFSGERRYLEKHYAAAKLLMERTAERLDSAIGLLPKERGWHISDWPYPTIDNEGGFLTAQNIKVYRNFDLMAQIAGRLGREEDASWFRSRGAHLGAAICTHLYDEELKRFIDSSGSARRHQGVNVLALEAGLVPEEEREDMLDYIVGQGHQCKTLLSLNLLRVLFENGREKDAYRLLNHESYPGWGYMVAQGSRTIWEGFDDIESHCHAWNAYPAKLLTEYIVGIQCGEPGFSRIVIKPWLPEDMSFAESSVHTPAGKVRVRWEHTRHGVSMTTDIPPNASATIVMPELNPAPRESSIRIWKDGRRLEQQPDLPVSEVVNGRLHYSVESGHYVWEI